MEINPDSPQPAGSNSPSSALGNIQRPGEYLRHIRVAQNLELNKVASELNMPIRTLEALEHDDYKELPEAAFIKGYYRSYAKYLKTDATVIIQRFDEIYTNDTGLLPNHALNNSPIKMMGKLPGSKSERNKKWLKRGGVTLLVLLLLGVVVTTIQNWSSSNSATTTVSPHSDVEILSLNNGTVETTGESLVLNFDRPTSVHIVDSTGKVLATGRQATTLNLNGQSPFQIRLDDAAAVSLSLNQEPILLSPYTVNGKADFRLSR